MLLVYETLSNLCDFAACSEMHDACKDLFKPKLSINVFKLSHLNQKLGFVKTL